MKWRSVSLTKSTFLVTPQERVDSLLVAFVSKSGQCKALLADMILATVTDLKTACSLLSLAMCTEDPQCVLCLGTWLDDFANVMIGCWQSVGIIVTSSTLSAVTRSISARWRAQDRILSSAISKHNFSWLLSIELFVHCTPLRASSVLSISDTRESILHAGTMRYASSANLHSSLSVVLGFKSAAVTTYEAGPMAEPCMILALMTMTCTVDGCHWYSVLCERPERKIASQL